MTQQIPIHQLSALQARDMILSGATRCTELMDVFFKFTDIADQKIHAFSFIDREAIMRQAELLDQTRERGTPTGPLFGIPIAIKDAIDTFDMPAEYGSSIHAGRHPRWDAPLAARLRQAGAIFFGKTKLPEFCLGKPADTCNPHNLAHTPGGSSSGSAAAVAAGMVPVAIGTQTVGSVIRPASYCGVIGFKPTRGLISRSGLQPLSRTFDQVGVFGRNIADVAAVTEQMIGADADDRSTIGTLTRPLLAVSQSKPPFPPKFVFIRTPFWDQMDADAQEAMQALVDELGEQVVTLDLPQSAILAKEWLMTAIEAEFAQTWASASDAELNQLSDALKDLIARGKSVNAVDYLDAISHIERVAEGFDEIFERFDAILTPSALGAAPKGLDSTGNPIMSALWSYTGMPCISLPLLQNEAGMPIGVQVAGPLHDDARLLRTSQWLMNHFSST